MKLTNQISAFITDTLITSDKIESNLRDAYIYIFNYIIDYVVYAISIIFLGFIFHNILNALIFLLTLIPLRYCAGGLHASTEIKCQILSYLTFFIVMLATHIFYNYYILLSIFYIFSAILIVILTPVDNPRKRFNCIIKKKLKNKCIKLIFINTIIYFTLIITHQNHYCATISICYIIVLGNQLLGIKKYGRQNYDT